MTDFAIPHKGIQHLPFYFSQKFTKIAAVFDLYFMADKNGAVNTSTRMLGSRWRWSKTTVAEFIVELQECGIIVQRTGGNLYLLYEHKRTKTGTVVSVSSKPKTRKKTKKNGQKTDKKIAAPATSSTSNNNINNNNTSNNNVDNVNNNNADYKESHDVLLADKSARKTPRDCKTQGAPAKKQSGKKVKKQTKKQKPKKVKELEEGEHSPMMAIGVHLICTQRTFDNYGALREHIKANIRASRGLRFYTPRQIATACVIAMAEAEILNYRVVHLATIAKKMSLCDEVSEKESVRDYIDKCVSRYNIEQGTWHTSNSTLIAKNKNAGQDMKPEPS